MKIFQNFSVATSLIWAQMCLEEGKDGRFGTLLGELCWLGPGQGFGAFLQIHACVWCGNPKEELSASCLGCACGSPAPLVAQ